MPLSDQSRFTVNWRHSDSGLTDGVDAITEIARKLADPPGRPVIADANLAENPDCVSDHAMPVAVPMMIRMAPESAAVSISIDNKRRHTDIPSNIQHERGRTGTLSCSVLRLNGGRLINRAFRDRPVDFRFASAVSHGLQRVPSS